MIGSNWCSLAIRAHHIVDEQNTSDNKMTDARFYTAIKPLILKNLIAAINAPVTLSPEQQIITISGIGSLEAATPSDISFFTSSGKLDDLLNSNAAAIFITEKNRAKLPAKLKFATLICTDSAKSFAQAIEYLFPKQTPPDYNAFTQHNGAYIHPSAKLENNISIAPGTVIEANVEIGQGTTIGPNCTLHQGVKIGRNCTIHANVTLQYALLGNELTIHPGVRIGQDGFSFLPTKDAATRIPQMGRVILQDNIDIGANTTIDRGALTDTVIGEGAKIDNLVQIGHNCQIGRHVILCGCVALAGSTIIEDNAVLGGRAAATGHLRIGRGAQISANSLVTKSVPAGERMGGSPAKPAIQWRREQATLTRLAQKKERPAK